MAGGVVGQRHVAVAALAGGLGHLLHGVAAIGERVWAVQLAADVPTRRGPAAFHLAPTRSSPRASSAPALYMSSRGLVDLLLGGAELHVPRSRSWLSRARRPRAPGPRRLREAARCAPGSGEMLEQVAEGLRRHDPKIDPDAVVGLSAQTVGPAVCRRRQSGGGPPCTRRGRPAPQPLRSGRCPCRSRPAVAPSRPPPRDWRPDARAGPPPIAGDRCDRREQQAARALARSPRRSREASTFSSNFGPSPFSSRIL